MIKENKKRILARELKKVWNMKVTGISVLETVVKSLLRGLEELEI